MLLVDGGFPIDVIFDASVWERRKKKKKGEKQQGEQAYCVMVSILPPSVSKQSVTQGPQQGSGTPATGAQAPHISCTQPRCHPPL